MEDQIKSVISSRIFNYLTIDVEDYYHVSAFERIVEHKDWNRYDSRIEVNTKIILDLLDSYNIKATFFVLGWIAGKFSHLIKVSKKYRSVGMLSIKTLFIPENIIIF